MRAFLSIVGCLLLCISSSHTLALAAKGAPKAAPKVAPQVKVQSGKITLLKAGTGAQRVFAYRYDSFQNVPMHVTSKMTMQMSIRMGKQARNMPAVPTPAMRIETTLSSKGTDKKGMTRITGKISGIKVLPALKTPPIVVIQLRRTLAKLIGSKVIYLFDEQGRLTQGGFKAPKGTNQQMRQILNNIRQNMMHIIVPLPKEKIGIGAQWRVNNTVLRPFRLNQSTVYTLRQIKGKRLVISAQMNQRTDNQRLLQRTPYGIVKNHIHKMRIKSRLNSQVGTRTFFIASETKGHSDMKMTVTLKKRVQHLRLKMQMGNNINTKPKAAKKASK